MWLVLRTIGSRAVNNNTCDKARKRDILRLQRSRPILQVKSRENRLEISRKGTKKVCSAKDNEFNAMGQSRCRMAKMTGKVDGLLTSDNEGQ